MCLMGFSYSEGIDPDVYPDAFEALYFSLVSLSTLGFGEVVPIDPFVRLLSPMQAVTGFALLTGGATWLLQLFPTLARQALDGTAPDSARSRALPAAASRDRSCAAASVLHTVAERIASVRVDLSQSPESYYFREGEAPTSLGHALPIAQALADAAAQSPHPACALAGSGPRRGAGGTGRMPARELRG